MTITEPTAGDGECSIRRADRADLLDVVEIEDRSFPQPWPYNAFEGFLGRPGFLVAADGTRVEGYVVSDVTPNHGRGIGHVKDIAVHPDRRGRGIGSALLARSIGVLKAHGAASVKLEVRESNEGAKRLYRKSGFDPSQRVPRYYDDGEDAIVMVQDPI